MPPDRLRLSRELSALLKPKLFTLPREPKDFETPAYATLVTMTSPSALNEGKGTSIRTARNDQTGMTTISALTPEHFELVATWLSKSEINRWLTAEWRDKTATSALVAMVVRNKRNRVFLVHFDGEPCGVVALADIDTTDKTAMVWYFIGESALVGRGVAADAVKQLVSLSFRQMGLASLYAWAMEDNQPSKGLLRKVGFREAGRIRRATSSRGRQLDRVYFDLVADEVQ
jgi:RimJ/RimL family protein N-acetyltransferase